ncbi:OmpA family protein [Pasteurella atlantica]|uniref:OmpA family protein n=1 Tax=Pasteurellaceae TaxID=712 RepID=UPI002765EB6F|nr:OmpA family protein [Pasteurella atlantica]MDP8034331.1 OmpA family protein [Pasteurella atlantica]MDP8036283.1 OmpA family protein [Pasteurella atlantica]MDP8038214.1 OmpA family protein [Pasteurella atlantica]MDP8048588.1 OmpA family protein [Pasteurella atlantica]MDP8050525.1 OmpA family protein [Pasteurella atlantica]
MRKTTKKYLIMLIVLWIVGCLLQSCVCCGSDVKQGTNVGFNLVGDNFELDGKDGFNFVESEYVPVQPYSEELQSNLTKTVNYLKDNSARQLTVTGLFNPNEVNSSVFPDLGLARAKQIKDHFGSLGANSQQIMIASRAYPEAVKSQNNQYLGMAEFSVKELDKDALSSRDKMMQALLEDVSKNPLMLYFETGATNLKLSELQRQGLLKIASYLDYSPSAKVSITGHTDNTGDPEKNILIGKERATFVANYLEKNGLKKSQLDIDSKGSDEPIADNSSAEGRAKNRRVTISIDKMSQ